ncbi:MAG: shikimate kinase AroK [Stagnimonas sp.]|nr:shikimate kinase AroK [Stagnimonas sp.]
MRGDSIFLVGPMGAGKTTIGKKLAEQRGLRFIDSDHEIEARTGVDIAFIFEKEGESGFRKREQHAIEDLTTERGIVLATGGGAVLMPENRTHLKSRGFVVYLHASVSQQFTRVERSDNRPLLAHGDRRETLTRLFAERDPLYREVADLVLDTDGKNAKQLAREIELAVMAAGA